MSSIFKTFLACLFTIPCLYGSQIPRENIYITDNGPLDENKALAPVEEVELCRRLFGLQAECEADNTQAYMLYGGLLGTGLGIAKYYRWTMSWKELLKACALTAAGAIIGGISSIMLKPAQIKNIRTARTSFYFPEEYMAKLQDMLEHGKHVYVHAFKDSGKVAQIGEGEIRKWHALTQSKNCFVCHTYDRTEQLIAEVPYYSPEALLAYKGRDTVLRPPISYDQTQELNQFCGNTSGNRCSSSMLYTHDERQNWYGCDPAWRPRKILLQTLSTTILRGYIEEVTNV